VDKIAGYRPVNGAPRIITNAVRRIKTVLQKKVVIRVDEAHSVGVQENWSAEVCYVHYRYRTRFSTAEAQPIQTGFRGFPQSLKVNAEIV
jgi:hypothetical protein